MTRKSNFELLRIVAMFMIVASHCVQHGAGNSFAMLKSSFSMNMVIATVLGIWGQLGVACFVIISSWFLAEKNGIHTKKVVMMVAQVWGTSVVITLLMMLIGENVSLKTIIKEFATPIYGQYWFITCYLIFYLIVPILQYLCSKLSDESLKKVFIVLTIIIPIYKFLSSGDIGNLGDFCYLFIATAYLKRKENNFIERHAIGGFIASFLIVVCSMIILNVIGTLIGSVFLIERLFVTRHILIYLMAMSLFYIFKNNIKIGYIKIINLIGKSTLGVYILHENILMRGGGILNENLQLSSSSFLWDGIFKMDKYYLSPMFGIYLIGSIFLVFAICSLVELLRIKFVDNMIIERIKPLDKVCKQMDIWYQLSNIK